MSYMETSQRNQLTLTQQGSYTQESGQWISHELYDTLVFPAIAQPMDFFQVPVGGPKSFAKTNMKQNGQLPVNQNFRFFAVEYSFLSEVNAPAADRDTQIQAFLDVCRNSWHQFIVDGREYDLQFAGSNLIPAIADLGAAPSDVGRITTRGAYRLGAKINLGRLTSFSHRVAFDASVGGVGSPLETLNTAGCELQIRLVGELARKIA